MQTVAFLAAAALAALAAAARDVPLLGQPEAAWVLSPLCVAAAAWLARDFPGVSVVLLVLAAQPWALRMVRGG